MEAVEDIGTHAIECYELCKHYGRGSSKLQVLDNLRMTVPKGKIYGLLGPSGCGKTTLLRSCLGRLSFDSGLILTLGRPPLTRGHGIPGRRVGYMPQELALYSEFTIKETLVYFGTLHNMSMKDITARIDFLLDLLNLPHKNRMVSNLSGGQQRRVSFAVALIQSPELLILDEPTVGVDPLLRQKIWEYLLEFAKEGNTTIILTTHYIEEARNADIVGLMRNGKLLSEESPLDLLNEHKLPTLEGVFLKLCLQDTRRLSEDDEIDGEPKEILAIAPPEQEPTEKTSLLKPTEKTSLLAANGNANSYTNPVSPRASGSNDNIAARSETYSSIPEYHFDKPPWKCTDVFPSAVNMWALVVKDLLKLVRNPGLTIFQFMIPLIEVSLFYLAIGGMPQNLPVGVVNLEDPPYLSQLFLDQLDTSMIIQKPVDSMEEALSNIKEGDYWGIIEIPANYSQYLVKRVVPGTPLDNETIAGSTIRVTLDATNQQIAVSLQSSILAAYEAFVTEILEFLGIDPAVAQIPVLFVEPVYGSLDTTFTNFMAPGIIISIIFFLAIGLTSVTFVVERKEGLLDRTWVAGVGTGEITLAHVLTQFLVIMVQIAIVLIFTFEVFKINNEGSLFLIILMCLLQGLCGMAFGLLISALCDTESGAIQLSLGLFYPILLLSGIIWPIQAIPVPLYYLSLCLPQTYASEGMRAILGRGWGLDHFEVWMGYIVTIAWWVVPLVLSAVVLRIRR